MQLPLQITSHNASISEAAEETIQKKAGKLEQFFDGITSCHVTVEAPHRHHNKGVLYNVRINIEVPEDEIVVRREQDEDLYVAIRDAFEAAKRQLKEYVDRRRGRVKNHEPVA